MLWRKECPSQFRSCFLALIISSNFLSIIMKHPVDCVVGVELMGVELAGGKRVGK